MEFQANFKSELLLVGKMEAYCLMVDSKRAYSKVQFSQNKQKKLNKPTENEFDQI